MLIHVCIFFTSSDPCPNVLSSMNVNVWMGWLCFVNLEPNLKTKPFRVQVVLTSQLDVFTLPPYLKTYMQVNELEGGEVLQVSVSLVVCTWLGDRFGDRPLYARASMTFMEACITAMWPFKWKIRNQKRSLVMRNFDYYFE